MFVALACSRDDTRSTNAANPQSGPMATINQLQSKDTSDLAALAPEMFEAAASGDSTRMRALTSSSQPIQWLQQELRASENFATANASSLHMERMVTSNDSTVLVEYTMPSRRYPAECYAGDGNDRLTIEAARSEQGWRIAKMYRQPC